MWWNCIVPTVIGLVCSKWIPVSVLLRIVSINFPYKLSFEFGSWTWRVRAKDGASLGRWSVDAVFDYVRVDPITAYGPIDGATVTTSTPTFTWEESDQDMYEYLLEVWTAENTRVVNQTLSTGTVCGAGTCTWTSTTTLPDGDYRWRVMGKKWPNTTGWTPMEEFIVED